MCKMAITTPCQMCKEQIDLEDMVYAKDGKPIYCKDCSTNCQHGVGIECVECNSLTGVII